MKVAHAVVTFMSRVSLRDSQKSYYPQKMLLLRLRADKDLQHTVDHEDRGDVVHVRIGPKSCHEH